jgi:hypothetical protein
MTQRSQEPFVDVQAGIYSRSVLPDEIDKDPPADPPVPGETNSFGGALPPAVLRRQELDALHDPQVLPDEIDRDPPQGPKELRDVLSLFAEAVRADRMLIAYEVIAGMAQDADLMAECIVAACRDFGIDVGEE